MIVLTVTPVNNVDLINKRVIDESKISTMEFNDYQELMVYDRISNIQGLCPACHISLYEQYLLRDDGMYAMLHLLMKGGRVRA